MSKPIVMAVDDQAVILRTIQHVLGVTYDLRVFTTGNDAVEYLSKNSADIVLLDYEMPGLSGYEVLMAIRADRKTSKMPVIFLTGETNERMKIEMLERGANDYLCKPIDHAELQNCVRKWLKSQ